LGLKDVIEKARPDQYSNDVVLFIAGLKHARDSIVGNGGAYSDTDFELWLFRGLLKFKHPEFHSALQLLYNRWELGDETVTIDEITSQAETKFNNLSGTKLGDGSSLWDQIDPRDKKIMALTTQLQQMKTNLQAKQSANKTPQKKKQSSSQQSAGGGKGGFQPLEAWRKKFAGDKKTVNGREYMWCKEHYKDGEDGFNGLYMPTDQHPDHATWKANKASWKEKQKERRGKKDAAGSSGNGSSTPSRSLQLNQNLKKVLMTKHGLSGDEINAVLKEADQVN
jgi:hypothetical protein